MALVGPRQTAVADRLGASGDGVAPRERPATTCGAVAQHARAARALAAARSGGGAVLRPAAAWHAHAAWQEHQRWRLAQQSRPGVRRRLPSGAEAPAGHCGRRWQLVSAQGRHGLWTGARPNSVSHGSFADSCSETLFAWPNIVRPAKRRFARWNSSKRVPFRPNDFLLSILNFILTSSDPLPSYHVGSHAVVEGASGQLRIPDPSCSGFAEHAQGF